MEFKVENHYGSRSDNEGVTRLPITDQLAEVWFGLAIVSCLLNFLVSTVLWDKKLKTHHKFVLSLILSDFLLSFCHAVLKFRDFPSHWTAAKFYMTVWLIVNGTSTFLFRMEIESPNLNDFSLLSLQNSDQSFDKSGMILASLEEPVNSSSRRVLDKDLNGTFNIRDWFEDDMAHNTSLITEALDVFPDHQRLNIRVSLSRTVYGTLDKILASLYLIPNITAPLAMWFITLSVLISVVKPLHVIVILSKWRGNVLVCTIWGFGVVVAGTVFGLIYNKQSFHISILINNTCVVIWYGTLICYATIPPFYIIIIAVICRSKFRKQARSNPYYKAAVTAFVVTVANAACNLPFIWIYIFTSTESRIGLYTAIFQIMYMLNTIFDPVIYAIRLPEVKTSLINILNTVKCFCLDRNL